MHSTRLESGNIAHHNGGFDGEAWESADKGLET